MTAYKFITTTTFDKEFKKLEKIIAKYIKNSQFQDKISFYMRIN